MSDDNPQFSQEEEDDGRTEPLGLTEFIVGNGTGVIDHNAVYDYEQQLGTIDEKRLYLMSLYDNIPQKEINKETKQIGLIASIYTSFQPGQSNQPGQPGQMQQPTPTLTDTPNMV